MAEPELQPDPLCVRFVNTVDWRDDPMRRTDPLKSYADLLHWARNAGAIPPGIANMLACEADRHPPAAQASFLRAITVREAIAAVLGAAVEHRQPPPEDLKRFNAALGAAGEHLRLAGNKGEFQLSWNSDNSFERVLWPLVRSAAELVTSDQVERLRRCEGQGCGWFFLDTTRNRSRRWCNMAVCGNRAKVKRFYERHKEQ
ncbi:MAG TPA: ABATE domain-containing protein [Terriglobales bacterium]|nr:ABATE domain-containing protein [Terriglobales bacterium]